MSEQEEEETSTFTKARALESSCKGRKSPKKMLAKERELNCKLYSLRIISKKAGNSKTRSHWELSEAEEWV